MVLIYMPIPTQLEAEDLKFVYLWGGWMVFMGAFWGLASLFHLLHFGLGVSIFQTTISGFF